MQTLPPLLTFPSPTGLSKYPTKEQILENLHVPTEQEINAVTRWKQTYYKGWSDLPLENKHNRLATLIAEINIAGRGSHLTYKTDDLGWRYYPDEKLIVGLTNNPSIVSAMHEVGHHLYGESELYACGYSVGMFSQCFRQEYERLQWKGHMLVKPYVQT